MRRPRGLARRVAIACAISALMASGFAFALSRGLLHRPGPLPDFESQACALPPEWLERIVAGYYPGRSGDVSLLPRTPAYVSSRAGGWTHSGPWPYVADVPLVFYGPGHVPATGDVDAPATVADIAPTIVTFLQGALGTEDGTSRDEVVTLEDAIQRDPPRLMVTVVWDGGGRNVLERWPESWPNLRRLMAGGVSFVNASVGSSPSVTPPVHTTIGTGFFPHKHGITGILVRDDEGDVVDPFYGGESARLIEVPAIAERWSAQHRDARIAMVGYLPWHVGMIGKGAAGMSGVAHDAAWVDRDTSEWITNEDHYRLPPSLVATEGLDDDLRALDAEDGKRDRAWGEHAMLDDPSLVQATPAFIRYHGRALGNLIVDEGYGRDEVTDLVFTNIKQIDRVGHFFNMESDEVRRTLEAADEMLGDLVDLLDREIGEGRYVVVVTADHGQQPDAAAIDGYGIDPAVVRRAVEERFGPVVEGLRPTEMFLDRDALARAGATVADVARFVGDFRLRDATGDRVARAGRFGPADRIFEMAVPAQILPDLDCSEHAPRG